MFAHRPLSHAVMLATVAVLAAGCATESTEDGEVAASADAILGCETTIATSYESERTLLNDIEMKCPKGRDQLYGDLRSFKLELQRHDGRRWMTVNTTRFSVNRERTLELPIETDCDIYPMSEEASGSEDSKYRVLVKHYSSTRMDFMAYGPEVKVRVKACTGVGAAATSE